MTERTLRRDLLSWYDAHKRDLPWRRMSDPYAIWVSEIMLQQTRVETVIPYYERFLRKFPTAISLADAPLDEVLTMWAGLGYYRRARMLHQGAQVLRDRGAHAAPKTRDEWLDVPGVGKYTAGAIASIAFGERAPVVDGNVIRVLTRLYGIPDDVTKAPAQRAIWEHAERLVDDARPGDFNQALIELGATVCRPKNPACAECPWQRGCVARAEGKPEAYPRGKAAAEVPIENVLAYALFAKTRVLLAQREERARYGGMWEPPMLVRAGRGTKSSTPAAAKRALGWSTSSLSATGEVTHVLSHRRVIAQVFTGTIGAVPEALPAPYVRAALVSTTNLDSFALSRLARRVLATLD